MPDRPDVPPMEGWREAAGGKPGGSGGTAQQQQHPQRLVHLLNLAYDLTPADVVNVVISEMGAVPPTSVAVILRESVRDAAVL